MRWALLLLAGCNQVYGLDSTQLTPADAPRGCPAFGEPLKFSPYVGQSVFQDCIDYQIGGTRAIGFCNGALAEGNVDQPLAPMMFIPRDAASTYQRYTLWPDGETMFVFEDSLINGSRWLLYARNAAGMWTSSGEVPGPMSGEHIGAPSSSSPRHAFVSGTATGGIREVIDDGQWSEVHTYDAVELGNHLPSRSVQLSPDGLRMMYFVFKDAVYYSQRAKLGDKFPVPTKLEGAPVLEDAFLTADCQRLYFSGLGRVFFELET